MDTYRESQSSPVIIRIGLVSVPVAWSLFLLSLVILPVAFLTRDSGNAWLFVVGGAMLAVGLFLLISARDIEVDTAHREVRIRRWRSAFTRHPRSFPFGRFGPIFVERRGGVRRLGGSTHPLSAGRGLDYPEHVWVVVSALAGTLAAGQRGEMEGVAYRLAELTDSLVVHRSSDEWGVHIL